MNLALSIFLTVHITIIIVIYKIHMMGSFFVVWAKTNIKAKVLKWKRRLPKNIQSDCEIELTGFYTKKSYSETIRLVRFWDEEDERSSFI